MLDLACVDGGLLCGPLLIAIITALLGWIGWRQRRCKESGCDHRCHAEEMEETSR